MSTINLRNIVWSCTLLFTGAILALIFQDLEYFVYDNSFNIFELFYFIISIAVAIFVTSKLDEAIQRNKSQKDIIIKKIEEVDAAFKDLYKLMIFNSNDSRYQINNTVLLGEIKNIGLWAKRYEVSISEYYNGLEKNNKYSKINTRSLVSACTKLPKHGKSTEISCTDNKWSYSEERFALIQSEIEKLRSICYQNIILLNSSN